MADERPRRTRRTSGEQSERSGSDTRPRRRTSNGLTGAQLAQKARRELAEITGLEPGSVTALQQSDDGKWNVTVELLELSRVPDTDDVLGAYEVELDQDGELLRYARVDRYSRSQTGQHGAQDA